MYIFILLKQDIIQKELFKLTQLELKCKSNYVFLSLSYISVLQGLVLIV